MAGSGFLPDRDADLLTWATSASGLITATPTAFGLTAAIATSFAAAVAAYQTALEAVEPGVRNKMAVQQKNAAKLALKNSIKSWSKLVEGTPTVTDAQKTQLGLKVRAHPSPIPAPTQAPNMEIVQVVGRTVTAKVHGDSGSKRARLANTRGVSIFSFTGDVPPASTDDWKFEGSTSKTKFDVTFPQTLAPGATVYLTAFWVGTRMESGPACEPVKITFGAAGVTTPAAA